MKPAEAGGKPNPESNQQTPPASAGFMLGSIFDNEDEGDTFLRNAWLMSAACGWYRQVPEDSYGYN
jgi:hypothetical protein